MMGKNLAHCLDKHCLMVPLEVNPSSVVYLQAVFETYEGLGIVRTVDALTGKVLVLTTPSLLKECINVLKDIGEEINVKFVKLHSEADKYLGYYKKKYQK